MSTSSWPITVQALACGHIAGDVCGDECAYWALVAAGELDSPDAYLVDGVQTLPPHAPGLRPLVDPALHGRAA